jgi:phage terminase small subunit
MGKRGRESLESAAVIRPAAFAERPEPPEYFNEYAAQTWRDVARSKPGDWFDGGNILLLESYCQHCHQAHTIGKAIDAFDTERLCTNEGVTEFGRLLAMAERETRMMIRLATSMRLTQQSKYATRTAARKDKGGPRPWEQ